MIIRKVNLNKENLLKIKDIDDIIYKDYHLTLDFYLERYNDKHTAFVLIDDKNIVGYLVSVPVKKELYEAIINGTMTNDLHINSKMFINDSKYNYLTSIAMLKKYRGKGFGKKLFEAFLEEAKGSNVALSVTTDGYNMCNKYMTLVNEIDGHIASFEYKKNLRGD